MAGLSRALLGLLCMAIVGGAAADTYTSLLLTSANYTGGVLQAINYTDCISEQAAPAAVGTPLTLAQLSGTNVSAKFWGADVASVGGFNLPNHCHSLDLPGYRSVQVYTGPAPLGCQAFAYDEADSVVIIVTITNSSNSWSVSIPKASSTTTEASCTAEADFCPLSTSPMCSSSAEQHGSLLKSFLADSTSPYSYNNIQSDNSCTPGSLTGDYANGRPYGYGLRAVYYQLDRCTQHVQPLTAYPLPDFSTLMPDPATPPRCQQALNYQAYNTTWPTGSPPLNADDYTGCFGAQLDGYVHIYNNTALQDLTIDHPVSYHNRFRVCLQYNGIATLTIAGVLFLSGVPDKGFDSSLSCVDTNLPLGWQPIHIDYAGVPEAKISVLQLFILPVSVVYNIYNVYPLQYGYQMLCDACSAFTGAQQNGCCLPVETCSFRSDQCFPSPAPSPSVTLPPPAASPVSGPAPAVTAPAPTALPPVPAPTALPPSGMPPSPVPPGYGSPSPAPGNYGAPSTAPSHGSAPAPSYGSTPAPSHASTPAPSYASAPGPHYGSAPGPHYGSAPAPSYGSTPGPHYGSAPAPSYASAPSPHYSSVPAPSHGGAPAPSYGKTPGPHYGSAPGPHYGSAPAPHYSSAPTPSYGSTPTPRPALAPVPGRYGSAPVPAYGGYSAPLPSPYSGYGAPIPSPNGSFPPPSKPTPAPSPACSCDELAIVKRAIQAANNFQELKAMLG